MKKVVLILAAALMGVAANAQVTDFPWLEDFENGIPSSFTLVDADEDGYNWTYGTGKVHNGSYCASSASWTRNSSGSGVILYPDNWMILPAMTIPADGSDFVLSWWAIGQDANYAAEHYAVYVATENTVEALSATTALFEGNSTATYVKNRVSLADYVGQTVYIAFRHYNVSDMFRLNIDYVYVGLPVPEVHVSGKNLATTNTQLTYTAWHDGTTIKWYVNGVEQSATETSFTTSIETPGTYLIKAASTNSFGTVEDSVVSYLYNAADAFGRTTLLEHFTTQGCQYCPGGHERIGSAVNSGLEDRVAWVSHHAGYGTDNYTIDASENDIIELYGGGTWAPAMMLDRNTDYPTADDEPGAVMSVPNSVSGVKSKINQALADPALANVQIDDATYDATTRQLSITVSGSVLVALPDLRLSFYITEDSLIGQQYNTSGIIAQYQHDHVLRATVGGSWGEPLVLDANNAFSKTLTYTLPAAWKAYKCRAVVFVNRYGSTIEDRQVFNAVKTAYLTDPNLSIREMNATMTMKTWPNPVAETAYIDAESTIHSFSVVNAMGQKVMGGNVNADVLELDVRNLAAGIYFVSVTTDNGTATERLSIVK